MVKKKKHSELSALVADLTKNIDLKTEEDIVSFTNSLRAGFIEKVLNTELDEHLGYDKHASSGRDLGNSRNGYGKKTVKGDHGESDVLIPRDRAGSFEPQLVKKHQTRLTGFDDKVLCLYAKGMTTREIVKAFEELYGASVSATTISKITDAVIEEVVEWRNRPLDAIYPIIYLDCIVVKIRQDGHVINKSIYLALGVNLEGKKELLGMWMSENEGSKFWLSVLTEMQNRGVQDILIACVDGLNGFPEAINSVYPEAKVQLCIVHMVRNSLKYVSWKDYKAVTSDLKRIYTAPTVEVAEKELDDFEVKWQEKYPLINKSWRKHWVNLITIFDYPKDIRKAIYTTNAIESLNSVIRKATKKRKLFPTDNSAMKVVYLAIMDASKKWTMPIHHWRDAMNRFIIMFEQRLEKYL